MTTKPNNEQKVSPFSRVCLVAYLVLIVYASWYPFSGWQINSLAALSDVIRQWPRYWSIFDVVINIIGYMPLGLLIVFSLYPRFQRVGAIILATTFGIAISMTMEGVQYFLPTRVTSILDLITNASGCLIGAIIGAALSTAILEKGRLGLLRKQWIHHESSRELLVLGLWPLAQIFPQAYLFGLGQMLPIFSNWLDEFFDIDFDLSAFLLNGLDLAAEEFLLSETFITACGCTGAILICLFLLNRHAPKFWLSSVLLIVALATKALASAILFSPDLAFAWLTPGAKAGLIISIIMLYGFSFAPPQVQRRLAILMLSMSLILSNLIPSNPYFVTSMQNEVQGKFLNFYGAAQFLSIFWPLIALWYLLKRAINAPATDPREETTSENA